MAKTEFHHNPSRFKNLKIKKEKVEDLLSKVKTKTPAMVMILLSLLIILVFVALIIISAIRPETLQNKVFLYGSIIFYILGLIITLLIVLQLNLYRFCYWIQSISSDESQRIWSKKVPSYGATYMIINLAFFSYNLNHRKSANMKLDEREKSKMLSYFLARTDKEKNNDLAFYSCE